MNVTGKLRIRRNLRSNLITSVIERETRSTEAENGRFVNGNQKLLFRVARCLNRGKAEALTLVARRDDFPRSGIFYR